MANFTVTVQLWTAAAGTAASRWGPAFREFYDDVFINPIGPAKKLALEGAGPAKAGEALQGGRRLWDDFVLLFSKAGDEAAGAAVNSLPTQIHHLASNKGAWADRFKDLFDKAGVDLDDAVNKMDLPGHVGRHTNRYHEWVHDLLKPAVAGKQGQAAKDALTSTLGRIRKALEANPRLPYSDGGL